MTIAVVGASGWIGTHVVRAATSTHTRVVGIGRRDAPPDEQVIGWRTIAGEASPEDLAAALAGVDAVVNTAGRAHQPNAVVTDFANDKLPSLIVEAASAVGAERVVHLSSIKALSEGGETTLAPSDLPYPTTTYGWSKLRGEQAARERADSSSVELVVVRVPMVHGPVGPGNLARIESLVRRGLPVPLPRPYPVRSVTDVVNLASLLVHLATMDSVPPAIVHWADTPHLTTRELVDKVAQRVGRPARVVPLPGQLARSVLHGLGKRQDAERLLASLIVEPSDVESLGWAPPYPRHSGFARAKEDV